MMKELSKIIIMSVTLLLLIIGIVVVLTSDVDFGAFSNLSAASISKKKVVVDTLMINEDTEKEKHETALDDLEKAKNQYENAKKTFDNISDETIDLVKEATKDEKYFIEYLWIVLGNYADDNNLGISIITPGSTAEKAETSKDNASTDNKNDLDTSVSNDAIKIIVRGRYSNVADFVYEIEHDKELKFKLDNIKMSYVGNNTIEATFNVLSLKVKK